MLMDQRYLVSIISLAFSGAATCCPPGASAQQPAHGEAAVASSAARGPADGCGSGSSIMSAEAAGRAVRLLAAHGFANVGGMADGKCLVVAYENTRYRDQRRGLREAAGLLAPLLGPRQDLVLVPTYRTVPLVTAHVSAARADLQQTPRGELRQTEPSISLDVSEVPEELLAGPRASSSFGRVDVVVHPWFQVQFGDFANPIASRTGIAPELRMDLRRGLSVSAQVLFTLQDDVPTGESRVRPGLVTINQLSRLPHNVFVSATAGTFNPNRYGADVEARAWFAAGRLSVGGEVGLTGAAHYGRDGWYRTPMRDRTALVDMGWRVVRYDLLIRATAGAFLEDERGVRLDVSRRFGEVEIGWFLLTSVEGNNGGFVLRVPLLPRVYQKPRSARLRTAESYRWQYRYHGFVPGGWRYDTGMNMWHWQVTALPTG